MTCRIREKNYGNRTPPVYFLRVSMPCRGGGAQGPLLRTTGRNEGRGARSNPSLKGEVATCSAPQPFLKGRRCYVRGAEHAVTLP